VGGGAGEIANGRRHNLGYKRLSEMVNTWGRERWSKEKGKPVQTV